MIISDFETCLYEKAGIWNYNSAPADSRNFNETHADKLYNYIRTTLLKHLNISSSADISFDVPDKLRKIAGTKHTLRKLKVTYVQKRNSGNMSVSIPVNDEPCVLKINTDISDERFKSLLYHELKHYWQISLAYSKFIHRDYNAVHRNADLKTGFKTSIDNLALVVYGNSPIEYTAYKEQIYDDVCRLRYFHQMNIKDIKDYVLNYIYLSKKYISYLQSILFNESALDNDVNLQIYISRLFLDNVDEISNTPHIYRLFDSESYEKPVVKQIRENIKGILNTSSVAFAYSYIDDIILRFVATQKDLVKHLFNIFSKRLTRLIEIHIRDVDRVIADAVMSVDKKRKEDDELGYVESPLNLYNYILEDVDGTEYIEFVFTDKITGKKKYYMLSDINRECIYAKFYILQELIKEHFNSDFVFKDIFIVEYQDVCLDDELVNDVVKDLGIDKLQYKTFADIKKAVDVLNKVKSQEVIFGR